MSSTKVSAARNKVTALVIYVNSMGLGESYAEPFAPSPLIYPWHSELSMAYISTYRKRNTYFRAKTFVR